MTSDSHSQQRKVYTKPELTRYGTLEVLTAGTAATGSESTFYAKSG